MLFASDGTGRVDDTFNKIIAENNIPKDWDISVILNCFKNKDDATEKGDYGGLLELMKN